MITKSEFWEAYKYLYPNADVRQEQDRERVFFDVIRGKSLGDLSNRDRELVTPERGEGRAVGCVVPVRLRHIIFPEMSVLGKSLPVTSAAGGASLVNSTMQQGISRYQAERNTLFQRTTRIPAATGQSAWPKLKQSTPGAEGSVSEFAEFGLAAVDWCAEGAAQGGTDPQFEELKIKTHRLAGLCVTSRLLARSTETQIEEVLTEIIRPAMLLKIDHALIRGSGVGGLPLGILNTDGLLAVNRGTPNEVNHDDLIDMMFSVPDPVREDCVWGMSAGAHKHLMKKKDSQNRPLYPNPKEILGYPVVTSSRFSALGAAADVTFGPWKQYICAVEQDFNLLRSDFERLSLGQVVFLAEMYVGGKLAQPQTFVKLN